jgi:hypothetical protein
MELNQVSNVIDLMVYVDGLLPFGELTLLSVFIVLFANFRASSNTKTSLLYSTFIVSILSFIFMSIGIVSNTIPIMLIILTAVFGVLFLL